MEWPVMLMRCNAIYQDRYSRADEECKTPCPFYIRYMRQDEDDSNSEYLLSDYNLAHNHQLEILKTKASLKRIIKKATTPDREFVPYYDYRLKQKKKSKVVP